MPPTDKPTPAERKAAREAKKAATQAVWEAKRDTARIRRAERALKRAGVHRGIKPRLLVGITEETIAREIAERGDQILDFDAWLNGPVGEPVGDALERFDGPVLYAAALAIVRGVRDALVRAGLIEAA